MYLKHPLFVQPDLDLMSHTPPLVSSPSVFALSVYLLLGLVWILVVMETCCELPQMKLLRQKFYQENVRELDSETINIVDHDQLSEQMTDIPDHMTLDQLPAISSVSEQAETLRQNNTSVPYTPASGTAVNGNLR